MIKEIRIENYKSIRKLKLELGRVTVLIGENGCGKSNILEAIALSAAAAGDKLDNEFLAPRGIRETEPELMRAAFDKDNVDKAIKISIGKKNKEIGVDYVLQNKNEIYSKWINTFKIKLNLIDEENRKNIFKQVKKGVSEEEFLKKLFEIIVPTTTNYSVDNEGNYLEQFLIYSPEYQCLRNFREEGQIRPLGINGEGLFKLLTVLHSNKNKDKLNEIKEKLKLIGWFKDFQIPNNLVFGERAIKIEDRYLDQELTFDQRSTNEGFLFLLFYFSLFISDDTPKFFAIDNIDASFNPRLCRRLLTELVSLAKKYDEQVIFTTHNPAILDGFNLNDDEQRLFVIYRNKFGYTKSKRILAPEPLEGIEPVRMSEAFLRGYIGGLPENF
jgi:predicted ATPase